MFLHIYSIQKRNENYSAFLQHRKTNLLFDIQTNGRFVEDVGVVRRRFSTRFSRRWNDARKAVGYRRLADRDRQRVQKNRLKRGKRFDA